MAKKKESSFQADLIKELKKRFEGSYVFKNDPNYCQGFPDLTMLYKKRWAILECKRSEKEDYRPNQEYYIHELNKLSYASVIYPENKDKVLEELERKLKRK